MKQFFIHEYSSNDEDDAKDLDLFAQAETHEQAAEFWLEYFECELEEKLEEDPDVVIACVVCTLPTMEGAGAYLWYDTNGTPRRMVFDDQGKARNEAEKCP